MKVAIAGGTGNVGRRLAAALSGPHQVVVWSRDANKRVRGAQVVPWDAASPPDLTGIDVVVDLAGANLSGKRWSAAYKRELRDSRIALTDHIVAAINAAADPPALVAANAVGYYGTAPQGPCPEDRAPGDDFLARLCVDWQASAMAAKGRVVVFRQGVILDPDGPLLGMLKPVYKMRLGGKIAGGKQPFAWVHHADVTAAYVHAIESDLQGVFNLVAPDHATQADFNRALAKALGVCALAPVPGVAIRLLKGEQASLVTDGQDVPADALQASGFAFGFPELEAAVKDAVA